MLFCLRVSVLFGHTKVNDVNNIRGFGPRTTDEEVVRLDISVDEILLVNGLHSGELESSLVPARN